MKDGVWIHGIVEQAERNMERIMSHLVGNKQVPKGSLKKKTISQLVIALKINGEIA